MAATMTWADPSMARATGLDGLLSWLAIWAADRPASTCGLYCAPARIRRRASARLRAARSAAIRSRARSLACGPRCGPADLPFAR